MVLVHGLLRADDRAVLDRVDTGEVRPRAVASDRLVAVVSEAPEHGLTAHDAVTHLDLLIALAADVPVLPLPFGTTAPDDDAVREEVLTPAAARLERQLDGISEFVEVRVDLAFDLASIVVGVARDDREIERLASRSRAPGAGMSDQIVLGEAVAERVADVEAKLTEQWTAELADAAERSVLLEADEQVRRTAHLVRRERLADADDAVAHLREAAAGQAEVEYFGPLPVYSFLDDVPADEEPTPPSFLDDVPADEEPTPPSRWAW